MDLRYRLVMIYLIILVCILEEIELNLLHLMEIRVLVDILMELEIHMEFLQLLSQGTVLVLIWVLIKTLLSSQEILFLLMYIHLK